jgi:hypothetical protein
MPQNNTTCRPMSHHIFLRSIVLGQLCQYLRPKIFKGEAKSTSLDMTLCTLAMHACPFHRSKHLKRKKAAQVMANPQSSSLAKLCACQGGHCPFPEIWEQMGMVNILRWLKWENASPLSDPHIYLAQPLPSNPRLRIMPRSLS